jgi:hypothetical protein
MKDINWPSDIKLVVEDLVRERRRQKLLAEASEIRKGTKKHWGQWIRTYPRG